MRVSIQVENGDDGVGGADLLRWLRKDPVAAHARLDVPPAESGRGEMGVAETVQAVLDNATGLGSLLVSVAAWRDARRQNRSGGAPVVRVRTGRNTVEIIGDDPAEVSRLVNALMAADWPAAGGDASAE